MFERFRLFKQEIKEVKLNEIPSFLDERFVQEKKDAESRLASHAREIVENLSHVKRVAQQLKPKSSPNNYANILKDKFCDKVVRAIDSLGADAGDYESLVEFVRMSGSAAGEIGNMGVKEFRQLHAFREDMSKIAEKMKTAEYSIAQARRLMQNSPLAACESIKAQVVRTGGIGKQVGELDREILEMESTVSQITGMIERERGKIEETNSSIAGFAGERLQIKELEKSFESIRRQVDGEFSGMDRIMKKFLYFGELSKEETAMLKEYIKDPGSTFLNTDDKNTIRNILDAMDDYKDKKVIDLDNRKAEKLKDLIRQFDFLVALREHYRDLKRKKDDAEERLDKKTGPLKQAIKLSTAEITAREKDLSSMQARINGKKIEKQALEKQVLEARIKIELDTSNLLGNQVRIV